MVSYKEVKTTIILDKEDKKSLEKFYEIALELSVEGICSNIEEACKLLGELVNELAENDWKDTDGFMDELLLTVQEN